MNVLWLGGIVLPKIADKENLKVSYSNGWLIQLSEEIGGLPDYNLTYVFDSSKQIRGENEFYSYYGIINNRPSYKRIDEEYLSQAMAVLDEVKPDIVHIWGTERPHTLAMVEACERMGISNKVIISIQGLVYAYYYHYTAYLPNAVVNFSMPRDLVQGNIRKAQKRFQIRGEFEKQALKRVNHVIGRTDWDKACLWNINPDATYHFNNETLRSEFYSGIWNFEKCEKNTLFCSQGYYPIKGIHLVIEALKRVVRDFPDVHLYIGGKDYLKEPKWKLTAYGAYIINLIKRYSLEGNVSFTGFLSADRMKERYLKSNIFISPSSIENSPNSLGEAMILGVPCISSRVGGVHNLLEHGKEGYLYPADEVYMLSYYICELLSDHDKAIEFGRNARDHALLTHDPSTNLSELLKIYDDVKGT